MLSHIKKFIIFIFISYFLSFLVLPLAAQAKQIKDTNNIQIKKILLVVAMDKEAQPIISALNLHKIDGAFGNLPMQGYTGKYDNLEIFLVKNGIDPVNKVQNIGTQAATLSTYLGVEYFHPDLIISIGTAGGVEKNGVKQREIYASQKVYFFDRRIPIKGYLEYGLGGYQSIDLSSIDRKIGLKLGNICSGDSFDDSQTDYDMFIKQNCSAIDMEAAGVAWVSMLTKTPMFAMKGITNFVKGTNIHEQYIKNLPIVTNELAEKLKELLKYF